MARSISSNSREDHPPPATVLEELVVPNCEALTSGRPGDGPAVELCVADDEDPAVRACLGGGHLVLVRAHRLDGNLTTLRLNLLAGCFLGDISVPLVAVGTLLETTPFHPRSDSQLIHSGQLSVGCDLVVRRDDSALVRRRLVELVQLANDLEWYFPLRLPLRLDWQDVHSLDLPWSEIPRDSADEFLVESMAAPPCERTPLALLAVARGLGRWQDVLRLLREHRDTLPATEWAPLKCLALRQLGRWAPAIRAARKGGIRRGRFPQNPQLNPPCVHSLIEAGDDLKALHWLGKPAADEPAFHDWLRGLAWHRAGEFKPAAKAFERYFAKWPSDMIGGAATAALVGGDC